MSSTFATSPPAGETVNLTSPETSHQSTGIIVTSGGLVIMSAILLLRLYTKTIMFRLFAIDDGTSLEATLKYHTLMKTGSARYPSMGLVNHIAELFHLQVLLSFQTVLQTDDYRFVGLKAFRGDWELAVTEYNKFSIILTVLNVTYILTASLAKTALLLSYRRLWLVRWFKVTTFLVLVFIVSYSTALILSLLFACSPIKKNWDITITTGHCINSIAVYIAAGALNSTTDILLFVLPMPMVWNLRLRTYQKAGMIFLFGIGSMTLVVSLVWLALFIPVIRASSPDVIWEISTILVCVTVEANLVIICGCFPALRLLARRILPKWFGSREAGGERFVSPPLQPNRRSVIGTEGDSCWEEGETTSGGPSDAEDLTDGPGSAGFTKVPFVRSLPTRSDNGELGVLSDP